MSKRRAGHTLAIIVGLLMAGVCPLVACGEEKTAAARIEAMATLLAKAQRLSVTVDCTYDVMQDSGQKIEFGERRELTLRRPDRARVDVTRRGGGGRAGGGFSRGGGGFSRGGPAASGSFGRNRPAGAMDRGYYVRGPAADGSLGTQLPNRGER